MKTEREVSTHYTPRNLLARLNPALTEDGVDPDHPSIEALAPYDQFHGRGLEATTELAGSRPTPPITSWTSAAASAGLRATSRTASAAGSPGST